MVLLKTDEKYLMVNGRGPSNARPSSAPQNSASVRPSSTRSRPRAKLQVQEFDGFDEKSAPARQSFATFDKEDMSSHMFDMIKRGDSRAKFAREVPVSVRRFIWNTSPHKFWAEHFVDKEFEAVSAMIKYDGWFVVLYVTEDKRIRWQTTSGFLHNDLKKHLHAFKEFLKPRIQENRLKPNHAIKLEVTVQDKDGIQYLWLVGKPFDQTQYQYKIIVTDFFQPYNDSMLFLLMHALIEQRRKARKHKTAPLSASRWTDIFADIQGNIVERLKALGDIMGALPPGIEIGMNTHVLSDNQPKISGSKLILKMSSTLQKRAIEGCVLHCYDSNMKYAIYKFKQEYLGGLGYFYSRRIDDILKAENPDVKMKAGRQFVVRCLTVECLHGTSIPYQLGIGYYDEDLCQWVVSDCVKVKYVGGARMKDVEDPSPYAGERYIDVTKGKKMTGDEDFGGANVKHMGVTMQIQWLANFIAKVLDFTGVSRDFSNLHMTEHFKQESSPDILNVSSIGLIVGGSCNAVYCSEPHNYHMQAVVLKCMGISNNGSAHTFTAAEIENAKKFTNGMDNLFVIPGDISNEWTKQQWAEMTEIGKLNKSDVLSKTTTEVRLHERLAQVVIPVPLMIYSPPTNLKFIHCSAYKIPKLITVSINGKRTLKKVYEVVNELQGTFNASPDANVNSPIQEQVDIVFIPVEGDKFDVALFENIKTKLKTQFLLVRVSWLIKAYQNVQRDKDTPNYPDINLYSVNYGPTGPDNVYIQHTGRFLWKRAHERGLSGAAGSSTAVPQSVPAPAPAPPAPAPVAAPSVATHDSDSDVDIDSGGSSPVLTRPPASASASVSGPASASTAAASTAAASTAAASTAAASTAAASTAAPSSASAPTATPSSASAPTATPSSASAPTATPASAPAPNIHPTLTWKPRIPAASPRPAAASPRPAAASPRPVSFSPRSVAASSDTFTNAIRQAKERARQAAQSAGASAGPSGGSVPDPSAGASARPDPSDGTSAMPDPSAGTSARPDSSAGAPARPDPSAGASARPDPPAGASARPDPSASATGSTRAPPQDSIVPDSQPSQTANPPNPSASARGSTGVPPSDTVSDSEPSQPAAPDVIVVDSPPESPKRAPNSPPKSTKRPEPESVHGQGWGYSHDESDHSPPESPSKRSRNNNAGPVPGPAGLNLKPLSGRKFFFDDYNHRHFATELGAEVVYDWSDSGITAVVSSLPDRQQFQTCVHVNFIKLVYYIREEYRKNPPSATDLSDYDHNIQFIEEEFTLTKDTLKDKSRGWMFGNTRKFVHGRIIYYSIASNGFSAFNEEIKEITEPYLTRYKLDTRFF